MRSGVVMGTPWGRKEEVTRVHIPAAAQEAEERLAELGPLATAIEWERAAIVYALAQPGTPGSRSDTFIRISFSRFAAKGIHGLRHHRSVSAYWHTWQRAMDAGIAPEVKLGDEVELPEVAWSDYYPPQEPNVAEAVASAIGADPRAVADKAYRELKERRELEEERNQALRDSFYEEDIQNLMKEHGYTREQAAEYKEEEDRPRLVEADRKAKRAEIHAAVRVSRKILEFTENLLGAADDDGLLRGKEYEDLREVESALTMAAGNISLLANQAADLDGAPGEYVLTTGHQLK